MASGKQGKNATVNHPKEVIVVVDRKDRITGYRTRKEVDAENLVYRVSGLWVKNSKGEHLLARRAYTKMHDPGRWGPAVAGTNGKGETYLKCIKREAKEELGLSGIRFRKGQKRMNRGRYTYFMQWFTCVVDKPASAFRIQKDEVAEVRWFSNEELSRALKHNPNEFTPGMQGALPMFG